MTCAAGERGAKYIHYQVKQKSLSCRLCGAKADLTRGSGRPRLAQVLCCLTLSHTCAMCFMNIAQVTLRNYRAIVASLRCHIVGDWIVHTCACEDRQQAGDVDNTVAPPCQIQLTECIFLGLLSVPKDARVSAGKNTDIANQNSISVGGLML
jgi:hypothetical protein